MLGQIVTLITLTSINFSLVNTLSTATKAFVESGINDCSDDYTKIPQDQTDMVYGAKNDAMAALIASVTIGAGFMIHVILSLCAVSANGWKKSC